MQENIAKKFEMEFAGRKLIVQTGELAQQTNGSCTVQYGDTLVLATVVMNPTPRDGTEFFPLMVDYEEKMYAAGRIKGSRFIKRETKPTDEAVLAARMIDRGFRPLFDESIRNDIQIIVTVLSTDGENDADIVGIIGASIALHISDVPWNGPLAGLRIGRINGELVLNPTYELRLKSDLDLALSVSKDKVLMVEASANEVDEAGVFDAFQFALKNSQSLIEFIEGIRKEIGKEKKNLSTPVEPIDDAEKMSKDELTSLQNECKEFVLPLLDKYLFNIPKGSKKERKETLYQVKVSLEEFLQKICGRKIEIINPKRGAKFTLVKEQERLALQNLEQKIS